MLGAYGWAFVKPVRKLYYNMTITFVSVIVALVVGGIEALGLLAGQFRLSGAFWDMVRKLNDNFGTVGYFIIGIFVLSWIASIAIYKWRRFDDLEFGDGDASSQPVPFLASGVRTLTDDSSI
jgi:high-affinity nickel-transport protein